MLKIVKFYGNCDKSFSLYVTCHVMSLLVNKNDISMTQNHLYDKDITKVSYEEKKQIVRAIW